MSAERIIKICESLEKLKNGKKYFFQISPSTPAMTKNIIDDFSDCLSRCKKTALHRESVISQYGSSLLSLSTVPSLTTLSTSGYFPSSEENGKGDRSDIKDRLVCLSVFMV